MPTLSRRHLLAGTGAMAAAAAVPASSQAPRPGSLAGKSFLVSGASSGFGRLGALHYARLGAKVFAGMRNLPRPEAEELRQIAQQEKLDLHIVPLDVLSDEQVRGTVSEIEQRIGGPIDVLVNNAGILINGPVEVQDIEATRLSFDTNVFGYQRLSRAVLPGMRQRKSGLIVNVSSQAGRLVFPALGLYAATKFAVEAMSEQLAYEVAPHGIDVLIIQPGGYPTNIGSNSNRYSAALRQRSDPRHTSGYPELAARMGGTPGAAQAAGSIPTDPMDVPRAIAEAAALPAGRRPLRQPVNHGATPQAAINRVAAETQLAVLGNGAFGPWAKAVLD